MSEPKPSSFQPRWYRSAKEEDLPGLEAEPWIGSQPLVFPRLTTRILPISGAARLPARSLGEIVEDTQRIANYAAYDIVNGLNPEFSDLRSMKKELLKFSELTVEPFEEGSFVISARLEAPPSAAFGNEARPFTTDDIAERFYEIFDATNPYPPQWLAAVKPGTTWVGISLGALQALESLATTLQRIDADLELTASTSSSEAFPAIRADAQFRSHVKSLLKRRRPTVQTMEVLEGKVTALDIVQGNLKLTVEGPVARINGSFPTTLHPKLLGSLGRRIRLFGQIDRKGRRVTNIYIHDSEFIDDE